MAGNGAKSAAAERQRRYRERLRRGAITMRVEIEMETVDDWIARGWLRDRIPDDEDRMAEIAYAAVNGKPPCGR